MTPFTVTHCCERDRGKRCIEINLYHAPIDNDSYHHRHNFHAEADKEGFKSQHHQFTDLHGCHRRLHLHGQRTNINGSLAVDDCNCERIADQIDCDPCLDKILEEHPCIYIMQVVSLGQHRDQLIAEYQSDDDSGNRNYHRL